MASFLIMIYRYTDDIAILAGNIQELQITLNDISELGKEYGLNINVIKTKLMIINAITQFFI
jgi:hypothetical protein